MSVAVTHTIDDLAKSNILPHAGNLDAGALALFGVGNNNDKPALRPGNAVALVANIFDFDGTLFALLDWWLRFLRMRSGFPAAGLKNFPPREN